MSEGPVRILFVCVENACRSQMAEAFARHYGHGHIEASSAGSKPCGQVDPTAIAVMQEKGIDLGAQTSKGLSDLPRITWDVVVGMGCGEDCAVVAAKKRLMWTIPDPSRQPVEVYRQVRDVIDEAVATLLARLAPSVNPTPRPWGGVNVD